MENDSFWIDDSFYIDLISVHDIKKKKEEETFD